LELFGAASAVWTPSAVESEWNATRLSSYRAPARVLEAWCAAVLREDISVLRERVVSRRISAAKKAAGATESKSWVSVDGEIVSISCLCLVYGREMLECVVWTFPDHGVFLLTLAVKTCGRWSWPRQDIVPGPGSFKRSTRACKL
jgi:hypothetical protein